MMVNPAHKELELVKDEKLNVPVVLVYSDWLEENECLEEAEAWRWVVRKNLFPALSSYFPTEWVWTSPSYETGYSMQIYLALSNFNHYWNIGNIEENIKYCSTPLDALLDLVQARMVTK